MILSPSWISRQENQQANLVNWIRTIWHSTVEDLGSLWKTKTFACKNSHRFNRKKEEFNGHWKEKQRRVRNSKRGMISLNQKVYTFWRTKLSSCNRLIKKGTLRKGHDWRKWTRKKKEARQCSENRCFLGKLNF